jgi:hypothetical protein
MLQYLQPSSNAIQNMLIQQILTSPEQVYHSYDVTGQLVYTYNFAVFLYRMSMVIYKAYNMCLFVYSL